MPLSVAIAPGAGWTEATGWNDHTVLPSVEYRLRSPSHVLPAGVLPSALVFVRLFGKIVGATSAYVSVRSPVCGSVAVATVNEYDGSTVGTVGHVLLATSTDAVNVHDPTGQHSHVALPLPVPVYGHPGVAAAKLPPVMVRFAEQLMPCVTMFDESPLVLAPTIANTVATRMRFPAMMGW